MTIGSCSRTPYRRDSNARAATSARGTPISEPVRINCAALRSTVREISPWRAPSSMRSPSSRILCETVYAITPAQSQGRHSESHASEPGDQGHERPRHLSGPRGGLPLSSNHMLETAGQPVDSKGLKPTTTPNTGASSARLDKLKHVLPKQETRVCAPQTKYFHHLTSSTRRFLARPSSSALDATGEYRPQPKESRRAAAMPYCEVRARTTAAARRRLRSRL